MYGIFITALYLAFFILLTWPSVLHFNTRILADGGDGFVGYWNIWSVRHAVLNAQNPFVTDLLFYPQTTNLLIHCLNSFGGFLTIPFTVFLSDVAAFNLVVAFGFAISGLGAYLFAKNIVGRALPAFVGGYIFTFCNYHFAHAEGHTCLVLMQFIPFYFLFLYRLLTTKSCSNAVLAAIFLFLVLLCDYYYFLFCVLSSVLFAGWAICCPTADVMTVKKILPIALFLCIVTLTSGVFVANLVKVARMGEVVGHDASPFGMDLFALLIPGGHWRFHEMTAAYWQRLSGNIHESSVHVGLASLVLAVSGYHYLRMRGNNVRFLLLSLFSVFFVLSLGKDLQVFGNHIMLPMPYDLLEKLLPLIRVGGMPVRFSVITIFAVSMLAACGTQWLYSLKGFHRNVLAMLLIMGSLELFPRPVPNTEIAFPPHIEFLAKYAAAREGAVLDLASPEPQVAMVYQTRHKQPIQTAYLSRTQRSVRETASKVEDLVDQQKFSELGSAYKFRYVLTNTDIPGCRLLFDGPIRVFEIPHEVDVTKERISRDHERDNDHENKSGSDLYY